MKLCGITAYICLNLTAPILSSFYFCLPTVVALRDFSRQVVMTFGGAGRVLSVYHYIYIA
jgi:hypothetical protein